MTDTPLSAVLVPTAWLDALERRPDQLDRFLRRCRDAHLAQVASLVSPQAVAATKPPADLPIDPSPEDFREWAATLRQQIRDRLPGSALPTAPYCQTLFDYCGNQPDAHVVLLTLLAKLAANSPEGRVAYVGGALLSILQLRPGQQPVSWAEAQAEAAAYQASLRRTDPNSVRLAENAALAAAPPPDPEPAPIFAAAAARMRERRAALVGGP
ncbi:MAG: hypothetical protein IT340_20090 [Chloroflexi bacterium]|nr:hypothetical protein [Chloroflexota bacterium]